MAENEGKSKIHLSSALVIMVALFFAIMGLIGLFDPQEVVKYFSPGDLSPDMRNEVRAVYGGFGVAIAAVLISTLKYPKIAKGARLGIAISVLGMALGRIVSFILEPTLSIYPTVFLGVELLLAGMLIVSVKIDPAT